MKDNKLFEKAGFQKCPNGKILQNAWIRVSRNLEGRKYQKKKFSVNDRKLDFGGIDFFAFRAKTFAGISDYILWSRTWTLTVAQSN